MCPQIDSYMNKMVQKRLMVQKIRTAKTSGKQLCIHLSRVESGFGTVNSVHNGRAVHNRGAALRDK